MGCVSTSTSQAPPRLVTLDAEVVRTHQASVWRYLRLLGCPVATADDLTQEVFLVLLRQPVEERGDDALGRWLRRVAWNLCRAERRRFRRGLETRTPEELENAWSGYARADSGGGYRDALRACLGRLGGRARRGLELRYRDGASRTAIAQALGLGEEGAKTLLRRAKDHLRACIERRLRDERT